MATIEIDFEVFKKLTNRRHSENFTYNDVLRELLELPPVQAASAATPAIWSWKGVELPDGTELRSEYKGRVYLAKIDNGRWMQDGMERSSPSDAANAITKGGVNGWTFWSVKRPSDDDWLVLNELRTAAQAGG